MLRILIVSSLKSVQIHHTVYFKGQLIKHLIFSGLNFGYVVLGVSLNKLLTAVKHIQRVKKSENLNASKEFLQSEMEILCFCHKTVYNFQMKNKLLFLEFFIIKKPGCSISTVPHKLKLRQ